MSSRDITTAAAGVRGGEVGPTDPDFESTVLLINGDNATNGGQNNTFLDSSINNHTITRNGNVTQGSFSPFSVDDGKWGVRFSPSSLGSGGPENNLRDPNFTSLGTGSFTIECWVNFDEPDNGQYEIIYTRGYAGTGEIRLYKWATGSKLSFYTPSFTNQQGTTVLEAGRWYHIATVHDASANTITVYVDGVADILLTGYTDDLTNTSDFGIGSGGTNTSDTTYPLEGYISNFRVVNGTAVYTSSFTPPTEPLTAISGTQLLTCQSNRFSDNSTNDKTLEVSGTVKVVPFSPFAPSTAYNTSTKGGSGYFSTNGNTSSSSGTGQYLYTEYKSEFALGTNDFTIKFWCYPNEKLRAFPRMIQIGPDNTAWGASQLAILHKHNDNSDEINVAMNGIGGNALLLNSGPIADFQWIHVALTRSGSTFTLYINGQSVDTYTNSGSATGTGNKVLLVGSATAGNSDYNGYISNLYINNGVAESITLPTSLETDTTQEALLNFTNASIVDATGKNVLETVGNAQVDTTTVKYGTGAMEFDGTGDYLNLPDSENFAFGTGDFTVEFWINKGSGDSQVILDNRPTTSSSNGFLITIFNGQKVSYYTSGSPQAQDPTALVEGQWIHYALARSSGTTRLFRDGVVVATKSSDTFNYTHTGLRIVDRLPFTGVPLNGYLDDLRITKGIARYTTNFTPPEAALPVIGEE